MTRFGDFIENVVDAEYEVIEPARAQLVDPRHWSGLGLPPEWRQWGWFQRLVFVVAWLFFAWWGLMVAIEVKALVPLLLR